MMTMRSIKSGDGHTSNIQLRLDLTRRRVEIHFSLPGFVRTGLGATTRQFKLTVALDMLAHILEHSVSEVTRELIIPLTIPAEFYLNTATISAIQSEDPNFWNENDIWFRQTDIVENAQGLSNQPLTLRKQQMEIDIGKSRSILLTIS